MIEEGRWNEGERIPGEIELSGMFEVSRNSVRESIKALELIGILRAKSGSGTYVSEHALSKIRQIRTTESMGDDDSIIEIMEARILIEPGLARLAVGKATQDDIRKLRDLLALCRARFEEKAYDFELGFLFHSTLFELSGNKILIGLFDSMKDQLIAVRRRIYMKIVDEKAVRKELDEHSAIVDLIEAHKGAEAESLMRKHLEESLARLKKKL